MTDEQINWTIDKFTGCDGNECDGDECHPDYCADLNAMHEAKKSLSSNQWWVFVEHLINICGGGIALCISATARQRAEAFLRTLGKWEPTTEESSAVQKEVQG